jgi:hypothetical protein
MVKDGIKSRAIRNDNANNISHFVGVCVSTMKDSCDERCICTTWMDLLSVSIRVTLHCNSSHN